MYIPFHNVQRVLFIARNRIGKKKQASGALLPAVDTNEHYPPCIVQHSGYHRNCFRMARHKKSSFLLFLFGLGYLILYNLATTVTVSKQSERITRLTRKSPFLDKKSPT